MEDITGRKIQEKSREFETCEVKRLVVGELDVNCYLVWDKKTLDACIIDPGGDAVEIEREIKSSGLTAKYIINTHGHFDHVGGVAELKESLGCEILIHPLDSLLLKSAPAQAGYFGVEIEPQPGPDMLVSDEMTVMVGSVTLKILHTPGHTRGGISIYIEGDGIIFTGDTLFAGSVGRSDLPGGSHPELINSIKKRILPLGDSIMVFPGHGPSTTIGEEKSSNPFIA